MFLKEFKDWGVTNGFFNEEIVGKFPNKIENGEETGPEKQNFSCCTFLGIDGDKLKDDNYSKYYKNKPRSCDCIKIMEQTIDFIEFKTLKIDEVKNINSKVSEFELIKKLEGSYNLIKNIITEDDFKFLDKNDKIKEVNKKFIIGLHYSGLDARNELILANRKRMSERNFEGYFKQHPVPFGENFLDPIIIKIQELNKFYE